MAYADALKKYRDSGKDGSMPDKKDEGMDSDEQNSTTRIIKLSDDEQKAFASANPGEDLACEVHGSLEKDGHFHVMSVQPMGGAGSYDESKMAGQVAQLVRPETQISPS